MSKKSNECYLIEPFSNFQLFKLIVPLFNIRLFYINCITTCPVQKDQKYSEFSSLFNCEDFLSQILLSFRKKNTGTKIKRLTEHKRILVH